MSTEGLNPRCHGSQPLSRRGGRYEVESLAGARRIGEHCDIHLAGTAVGAHLCKGRWHTVNRRALHRGLRHGPAFLRKVAQNVHHISFQISLISPGAEQGLRIGAADQNRFSAVLHREARSEEHTSELQSLMRISYAVFCLTKKIDKKKNTTNNKKN